MVIKKKTTNPRGGMEQAVEAAEAVASAPKAERPVIPQRVVSIKINEGDYNRLWSLFAAQGTRVATAGRAALFYLAACVEKGELSIPNGVICKRRKEERGRDYPPPHGGYREAERGDYRGEYRDY